CSPREKSGCPDLNWGPLRPERSALPGCATPRLARRLSHRVGAALVSRRVRLRGLSALPEGDELGSLAAWAGEREAHRAQRSDGEDGADEGDDDREGGRLGEGEELARGRPREHGEVGDRERAAEGGDGPGAQRRAAHA